MNMSDFELNDAKWKFVLNNLKELDQPGDRNWCLSEGDFTRCVPDQLETREGDPYKYQKEGRASGEYGEVMIYSRPKQKIAIKVMLSGGGDCRDTSSYYKDHLRTAEDRTVERCPHVLVQKCITRKGGFHCPQKGASVEVLAMEVMQQTVDYFLFFANIYYEMTIEPSLAEDMKKNILSQIYEALLCLWNNGAVYMDMKPKNVMVNTEEEITKVQEALKVLYEKEQAVLESPEMKTKQQEATEAYYILEDLIAELKDLSRRVNRVNPLHDSVVKLVDLGSICERGGSSKGTCTYPPPETWAIFNKKNRLDPAKCPCTERTLIWQFAVASLFVYAPRSDFRSLLYKGAVVNEVTLEQVNTRLKGLLRQLPEIKILANVRQCFDEFKLPHDDWRLGDKKIPPSLKFSALLTTASSTSEQSTGQPPPVHFRQNKRIFPKKKPPPLIPPPPPPPD